MPPRHGRRRAPPPGNPPGRRGGSRAKLRQDGVERVRRRGRRPARRRSGRPGRRRRARGRRPAPASRRRPASCRASRPRGRASHGRPAPPRPWPGRLRRGTASPCGGRADAGGSRGRRTRRHGSRRATGSRPRRRAAPPPRAHARSAPAAHAGSAEPRRQDAHGPRRSRPPPTHSRARRATGTEDACRSWRGPAVRRPACRAGRARISERPRRRRPCSPPPPLRAE